MIFHRQTLQVDRARREPSLRPDTKKGGGHRIASVDRARREHSHGVHLDVPSKQKTDSSFAQTRNSPAIGLPQVLKETVAMLGHALAATSTS